VTNKLVVENLKHRPLRTLLSVVAISIQVTMVLTLVGLSDGMLDDMARRARGVGADIMVRAPSSSVMAFSANMPQKIMSVVDKEPPDSATSPASIWRSSPSSAADFISWRAAHFSSLTT
jgi:putative ABC transport system permease protein